MDFLGTLLVGWLLTNLPSIITMAQELIARMQRLSTIVTGFFNNTVSIFRGFGNVLGAVGKNILTFDFTDSNKRVENAVKGLGSTFDNMQNQFDQGFRLLTTSLGEGIASGQDAAPTGTQYPNQSMQESSGGGGGTYGESSLISAMDSGGITDKTERSMFLAQMRHESGNFKYDEEIASGKDYEGRKDLGNVNPGDGVRYKGRGYVQLTGRANYRTYGNKIGVDLENNPDLAKRPDIAAAIAIAYWNSRVNKTAARSGDVKTVTYNINGGYNGLSVRQKYFDDYVKKGIPTAQTTPTPAKMTPAVSTTVRDELNVVTNKSSLGGLTPGQGFGAYRSSRRNHAGIDIGTYGKKGFYVSFKQSGTVTYAQNNGSGYGNLVIIKVGNIEFYFAHLAKIMVKNGQPYNGQTIGEIGKTGGNYDVHLHFEARPGGKSVDPNPWLGLLSIGRELTGTSGQPATIFAPTPAQIASQGTQQRQQMSQQLSQQRNGPTIVVIEEDAPPQLQASAGGGGGGGMIPIIINPLNSFITKKLLLDLAYT
jgi:predicted chitinase